MGTTNIETRLRGVIERIAPNQTARYNVLATKTNVARHKWVNWANERQGLSLEMLEAFTQAWPEHAIWVATGQGMPPEFQRKRFETVVLTRDKSGKADVSIEPVVSRHRKGTPPKFEWGYVGSGPRELAMNILYLFGLDEPEADCFSRHFAEDVLSRIDHNGGEINELQVDSWIQKMSAEIQQHVDKRLAYEQLRAKHEAELKAELEAFERRKK